MPGTPYRSLPPVAVTVTALLIAKRLLGRCLVPFVYLNFSVPKHLIPYTLGGRTRLSLGPGNPCRTTKGECPYDSRHCHYHCAARSTRRRAGTIQQEPAGGAGGEWMHQLRGGGRCPGLRDHSDAAWQ